MSADLELARGDGSFAKLFSTLTKADLLVLDDCRPDRLTAPQRRDLMEIVVVLDARLRHDERSGRGSTLITRQLTVDAWHDVIGAPTFADAILDRFVHVVAKRGGRVAYRLALDGPSTRKPEATESAEQ